MTVHVLLSSVAAVACAFQLDVAVEIIGERSLHIEELEEDIADMKAIFHTHLDEATRKLHAAEQQLNASQAAATTGS